MMITTARRVRPSLIGLLLITLMVLLSGCGAALGQASAGDALALRAVPGGPAPRSLRIESRVTRAADPALRADSMEVAATWSLPPIPDQYGPIDSVLVIVGGGLDTAMVRRWVDGEGQEGMPTVRRWGPPSNQSITARFTFDLAPGAPGTQAGTVWLGVACVYTMRRSVLALPVCGEGEVHMTDLPPPPQATNLSVTARIVSGGNE